MFRLFNFLYRFRDPLTFILIEVICFSLIVSNNRYQGARFFNSSNSLAAGITSTSNTVRDYFLLGEKNLQLAEENAELKRRIDILQTQMEPTTIDTLTIKSDTISSAYRFITAKVVDNTTQWRNNTITLNKGEKDGITPGLGVVGDLGIIGRVKYVSKNFSVAISLLHSGFTVSSRIEQKVQVCTAEWDGLDPAYVRIKYVPRHHNIAIGDSVFTSGYNSTFPPHIPIGLVTDVRLSEDANFYDITAKLVNDFTNLSYVHIVESAINAEKDSLESLIEFIQ